MAGGANGTFRFSTGAAYSYSSNSYSQGAYNGGIEFGKLYHIGIKGLSSVGDFMKNHFVLKVEATATFGVQYGLKRGSSYLEGGIFTTELGRAGWSLSEGGYKKGGDGKGHNFLGANINMMNDKVALGGNVDYVTNDIMPTGGDLLEYYPNNGNLEGEFSVGKNIWNGKAKSAGTFSNKEDCVSCYQLSGGFKAFLGIQGKLIIGFK